MPYWETSKGSWALVSSPGSSQIARYLWMPSKWDAPASHFTFCRSQWAFCKLQWKPRSALNVMLRLRQKREIVEQWNVSTYVGCDTVLPKRVSAFSGHSHSSVFQYLLSAFYKPQRPLSLFTACTHTHLACCATLAGATHLTSDLQQILMIGVHSTAEMCWWIIIHPLCWPKTAFYEDTTIRHAAASARAISEKRGPSGHASVDNLTRCTDSYAYSYESIGIAEPRIDKSAEWELLLSS